MVQNAFATASMTRTDAGQYSFANRVVQYSHNTLQCVESLGMARVFLSYASHEREAALALKPWLEEVEPSDNADREG